MERMWETTGNLGRPLGRSPFPRYLAQYLALVPRAHKAHSGRKVGNFGPACPKIHTHTFLHSSHVPNDAETHPRSRPSPTTPGGRPQGVSAQRNTSASAEGQTPSTPTPYPRIYARSVVKFTPSVYTTHSNLPVVGRQIIAHGVYFHACLVRAGTDSLV